MRNSFVLYDICLICNIVNSLNLAGFRTYMSQKRKEDEDIDSIIDKN